MTGNETGGSAIDIRFLAPADLAEVVAIDARLGARGPRRAYFERRLDAALRDPKRHVQFAAVSGGALAGYVLARRLAGEFGRAEPALRLEVIGVHPERRGAGIGRRLLEHLAAHGARHGVGTIRTQASWRDHGMLRFLDGAGFALGANLVIDAPVSSDAFEPPEADDEGAGETSREVDYGVQSANDYEALARDRTEVRTLRADDLDDVVRIDRRITGQDRHAYLAPLADEALGDAGVRVSLVARRDGATVGFVMAKTDFGDFGRTEPVAVVDTIGVDPGWAHAGIGHALLSQLMLNLRALRVERVETVVARQDFALLGFLYSLGFAPSQRLSFVREGG